jgi:hypothetical protein
MSWMIVSCPCYSARAVMPSPYAYTPRPISSAVSPYAYRMRPLSNGGAFLVTAIRESNAKDLSWPLKPLRVGRHVDRPLELRRR